MNVPRLESVVRSLIAEGKGILAVDESNRTCTQRFEELGITSTPETRRAYRQLLFSAPEIERWISGAILYEETFDQQTDDGTAFPEFLSRRNILPGIKVDAGANELANFPGEKITEGLDGLRKRLETFRQRGARFAKWRAVISVGPDRPTDFCVGANAHALARYAALCQEQDVVPIVEPEVLMDGDHSIRRCDDVTRQVLRTVFQELRAHRVQLSGIVLKPNMVISGTSCPDQASAEQVSQMTTACLKDAVPREVRGILFLSGGQSSEKACEHLELMNRVKSHPWKLSFSYGRALQSEALHTWAGKASNAAAAQSVFARRCELASAASLGERSSSMESAARG
jgi:fructose-bisphosphate aldolase class I